MAQYSSDSIDWAILIEIREENDEMEMQGIQQEGGLVEIVRRVREP